MIELRSNTQQIRNSVVFIRLIIKAFSFFNRKKGKREGKRGKRKIGKIKNTFDLILACSSM